MQFVKNNIDTPIFGVAMSYVLLALGVIDSKDIPKTIVALAGGQLVIKNVAPNIKKMISTPHEKLLTQTTVNRQNQGKVRFMGLPML